jgi:hypothetical protein
MRVLLTNLAPLLRDILGETLAGEADITMATGGAPSADLVTLVRQTAAEVVLTQASRDVAQGLAHALEAEGLSVSLVAIEPDARHAMVFAVGEAPVELSDVSPTTIVMAIRSIG